MNQNDDEGGCDDKSRDYEIERNGCIQIPKTTSSCADPVAPSLLGLAAEIRNTIFDLLLLHHKPILVENGKVYYSLRSDPCIEPLPNEEDHESDCYSGDDFDYDFDKSLPLLLSCRQICHECAGIFHGKNKFVLNRAKVDCHERSRHGAAEHLKRVDHVGSPSTWLNNLGSHRNLLTTVFIAAEALCWCWTDLYTVDMLPLLHLLWKKDVGERSITFIREWWEVFECTGDSPTHPRDEEEHDEMLPGLNEVLRALKIDDQLDPKHSELDVKEVRVWCTRGGVDKCRVYYNEGPYQILWAYKTSQGGCEINWVGSELDEGGDTD